MIAEVQLLHWYPALDLREGWARYTRDGTIPWHLFWLYYQLIPCVEAGVRLSTIESSVRARAISYTDPTKHGGRKRDNDDVLESLGRLAEGREL